MIGLAMACTTEPPRVRIADLDRSVQVRESLDRALIEDYAIAWRGGDVFPPVIVFLDGEIPILADGHHRIEAALLAGCEEVECEFRTGTKADALWFALGANRGHGKRLTVADKKHAIALADHTWPDRSSRDLGAHIGTSHGWVRKVRRALREVGPSAHLTVTGHDGKHYPVGPKAIAPTPLPPILEKTRAAVAARAERMRGLAAEGYSTPQIAAAVGITEEGARYRMKKAGIVVPADAIVGGLRRLNADRIVEAMVFQAEHLCTDRNLIEFAKLDRTRLPEWIATLLAARKALDAFISRLRKEHTPHE